MSACATALSLFAVRENRLLRNLVVCLRPHHLAPWTGAPELASFRLKVSDHFHVGSINGEVFWVQMVVLGLSDAEVGAHVSPCNSRRRGSYCCGTDDFGRTCLRPNGLPSGHLPSLVG
jgi:hypothetical protein